MSHRCSRSALFARAAHRPSAPRARIGQVHQDGEAIDTAVARWFYCDLLHGREVWPTERMAGHVLWFQIGNDLVAVRRDPAAMMIPARLVVDDPTAIAERCWDAGFTVQVRETALGGATLVVTDPFGRRLALVPRVAAPEAHPTLREESR